VKRLEERLKQLSCTGGETVQGDWDLCKSTIEQVVEGVLGRQAARKGNEWFDGDCERVTEEKNGAYLIMKQQHGTGNKVIVQGEKKRRKYIGKE
jgi:hypothetical protein